MSDKSVSKWERGICLPDVSVYLELCKILDISINEFLLAKIYLKKQLNKKQKKILFRLQKIIKTNKVSKNYKLSIMYFEHILFTHNIYQKNSTQPQTIANCFRKKHRNANSKYAFSNLWVIFCYFIIIQKRF